VVTAMEVAFLEEGKKEKKKGKGREKRIQA